MIQLPRVGWRLLACENGASPDCTIVVVLNTRSRSHVYDHTAAQCCNEVNETDSHELITCVMSSPGTYVRHKFSKISSTPKRPAGLNVAA